MHGRASSYLRYRQLSAHMTAMPLFIVIRDVAFTAAARAGSSRAMPPGAGRLGAAHIFI